MDHCGSASQKIALTKFSGEGEMRKVILAVMGTLLISIGAIDWLVGALVPHSKVLIGMGAVAVAVAAFLRRWQKLQEKITLPLMAVAASPLEQAFDPTRPAQMLQWNTNAVSGPEAWLYVLLAIAIWVVFYRCLVAFLRGCSWRNRPRCNSQG